MRIDRTSMGVVLTTTVLLVFSAGCTKKFPAWLLDRDGGPPSDADLDAEVQPDADDGEVPGCGNGVIDTGETCDDSNTVDNDGYLTVYDTTDTEVAQLPITTSSTADPMTGIS